MINFKEYGQIAYTKKHTNADDETAKYIVDTYNECIDNMSFENYIKDKVMVLNKEDLEKDFDDLLMTTPIYNLAFVAELMAMLNIGEFYEMNNECIFTTLLNKGDKEKIRNRKKINYIGICMEYERLATLVEHEIDTHKDVVDCVAILDEYGFQVFNGEWKGCTADDVLDRVNQVFGLS